uniref:Transactivator/viroplasmin protein n=1 Tax=Clandestinovirus TaxID=2831644 RepID=A0A8F8PNB7_9VIRU|nr:ribonuclease H [Clandestinovirus]
MSSKKFYAVRKGYKSPAIFTDWKQTLNSVKGYPGAEYKSFTDRSLAEKYLNEASSDKPTKRRVVENENKRTENEKNISLDIIGKDDQAPNDNISCIIDDTEPIEDKRVPKVIVYTDGACQNHPTLGAQQKVAGMGVWWAHGDPRNCSLPFEHPPITNQRAELGAILVAIKQFLVQYKQTEENLLVRTDSMYSIRCCTEFRHNWAKNGWKKATGETISNLDIIKQLHLILNAYPGRILFQHVKGHSNIEGNEMADELARGALEKYKL